MGISRKLYAKSHILLEILIRIGLGVLFFHLEKAAPFKRVIHQDEIWLYRNPITAEYVPVKLLWIAVIFLPILVFFSNYVVTRNRKDFVDAVLGFSLALVLNGTITDMVKLVVGRPRPDFFWRCFPDGEMNSEMECTGQSKLVMEGRKSFPSGHSSFSFVAMGFLSLYLMARLHVFGEKGRGQSWRLILSFLPLVGALLVALSRTCDYHHHWQDVVVGSGLGLMIAVLCYRQYFPPVDSKSRYRSPTHIKKTADLLQILELANETLKSSATERHEADQDEGAKLMQPTELKSNIKWI